MCGEGAIVPRRCIYNSVPCCVVYYRGALSSQSFDGHAYTSCASSELSRVERCQWVSSTPLLLLWPSLQRQESNIVVPLVAAARFQATCGQARNRPNTDAAFLTQVCFVRAKKASSVSLVPPYIVLLTPPLLPNGGWLGNGQCPLGIHITYSK